MYLESKGNFGRKFFIKFAEERGFDPRKTENWYKIKRSDVCATKVIFDSQIQHLIFRLLVLRLIDITIFLTEIGYISSFKFRISNFESNFEFLFSIFEFFYIDFRI